MAQMKRLLVDFAENENEITELLERVKNATPEVFNLFFDSDLSSATKKRHFFRFTDDEEIVGITVAALEMGLISRTTELG